jgi:hypothetical protein
MVREFVLRVTGNMRDLSASLWVPEFGSSTAWQCNSIEA